MKKRNKKIIINITWITVLIFLCFIKYYYTNITANTVLKHLIIVISNILDYMKKIFDVLLENLLTQENIKVIIILGGIIYICDKYKLIQLLDNVNSFQVGEFKLEKNKAYDVKKSIENDFNELEHKDIKDDKRIRGASIKLNLIETMIDNPYIVGIINKFLNRRLKSYRISLKEVKEKTNMSDIGKIFDYEIKGNSIKLIKIKDDIKDELIDVYMELIEKGAIYGECLS